MSKTALYNSLKTDLLTIAGVNTVALWRNQLDNEDKENPFKYNAIFIEFMPSGYREKGKAGTEQEYDLTIRLHICFETYMDEDIDVLTLTDAVFQKVQGKQYSNFNKLLRRNEEQNFEHDNVQDYIQDYSTLGHDTVAANTTTATLTPNLTTTINQINQL